MNDYEQTCLWAHQLSIRFTGFLIVVFDQPAGSPRYKVEGFRSILQYEERRAEFPATVAALYQNGRSLRIVAVIDPGGAEPVKRNGHHRAA